MQTIQLSKRDGWWMAKFSDPTIRGAFGTDTIPTAYRESLDRAVLLEAIQAMNPDSIVTFVEM